MTYEPEESVDEENDTSKPAPKAEGNLVKFYLNVFKRNVLIILTFALLGLLPAWFLSRKDPSIYRGKFEILVGPVTSEEKLTDASVLTRTKGLPDEALLSLDYPTILKILKSSLLLSSIAEELHNRYPKISKNFILQNLEQGLIVERVQQGKSRLDYTKVIAVSYDGSNPKFVQSVLEVAADKFLQYSAEEREKSLKSGTDFIDQQIPKLKEKIREIQAQQEAIQKRSQLVNPDKTGSLLVEYNLENQQKIVNIKTQLKELYIVLNDLQKKLGFSAKEALVASSLSQNPDREKLLSRLANINAEIELKSINLTPNHPTLKILINQQLNLTRLIDQKTEEILKRNNINKPLNLNILKYQDANRINLIQKLIETQNQINALSSRYQSLLTEEKKIKQNLRDIPDIIKRYNELERQLTLNTDILNQLSAQRQTLGVESAQKKAPWQLISAPAIPLDKNNQPVGFPPDAKKKLIAGLGGGLFLGILLSILLEKFRNIFYEPSDIEASFSAPILSNIDLNSDNNKSFLELYTNLYFTLNNGIKNSLLICSLTPEDKQAYITINLAKISADLGQKVLVVDSNLSNSEIDHYLPSSSGEVFSEKPCSLIANVPTIKNLSILPMGKLMENEIYNLSSLETHSLLDSISQDYSLILYDSSGFLESYDLSILADRTQGIILVVRLRGTSHSSLKKAVARINKYQLKLLGFVILSGKSQTASSNRPKRFLVL